MNYLMKNYKESLQKLYDHVGFTEDWTVYAIDDSTDMFWKEDGNNVYFADSESELIDEYGYENEIYKQRFYSKWVYRGKDLTMIIVDTHIDGNKFFQFFDNNKEIKNE